MTATGTAAAVTSITAQLSSAGPSSSLAMHVNRGRSKHKTKHKTKHHAHKKKKHKKKKKPPKHHPSPPPTKGPVNTAAPAISGSAWTGSVLSSSTGSWTGDSLGYLYQWRACNLADADCSNIAGATASRLTLAGAEVGKTIEVIVTAKNPGGAKSAGSLPTMVVANRPYRTFYVDYSTGRDSNRGTSPSAPWKDAPGMRGFSGSYSPQPGDHFIFRGGVTWPNAEFPLAATGSGLAGDDDYYGVSPSWYAGGSWTQPVFNAGNTRITGTDPNSAEKSAGANDIYMDLRGRDYIELDDIQFTGFSATSAVSYDYGNCALIEASSNGISSADQNITINRIYAHGMSIDEATGYTHQCAIVQGYNNNPPYDGNSVVENSVISGDGSSYGYAIWGIPNVENNTLDNLNELIITAGHGTIAGNQLYNCGYPHFPTEGGTATSTHDNAIETVQANGAFYIDNNVIHNIGFNASQANACEPMFLGGSGETDYVWDNVMYDIQTPNAILLDESHQPASGYVYNNTIEGGGGTSYCVEAGHQGTDPVVVVENNLCISTVGVSNGVDTSGDSHGLRARSLTNANNVLLTPVAALRDGYSAATSAFPWRPSILRVPTLRAGLNLTSQCTGSLIGECLTTTFAGALAPTARPAGSAWNAGAY